MSPRKGTQIKYPEGIRRCYVCKKLKPIEVFAKDASKPKGRSYRCRICHNEVTSLSGTKRKNLAVYKEMLSEQNGRCAICGCKAGKRCLAIDHDHKTNVVRGLLCHSCNVGLGHFRDSTKLLEAAISYLKQKKVRPFCV